MDKQEVQASAASQAGATAKEAPAEVASKKTTALDKVKANNGKLIGLKSNDIQDILNNYSKQMEKVLPKMLSAERMIAMASTEITKNPKLLECTAQSLIGAVLQASVLGFQPVAALGYCYFVPYGSQVQFQIGYKGMLALARRSGEIASVYAEVVREGDKFNYTLGLHRDIVHEPTGDISKPLTYVYAVVQFKDGGDSFVVLSRAEVERLRMRSPMQKATPSGAWATDYEAMAKAKAIKQLAKYLPLSIDTVEAIATDEAVLKAENFDKETGLYHTEDIDYTEVEEETPTENQQ